MGWVPCNAQTHENHTRNTVDGGLDVETEHGVAVGERSGVVVDGHQEKPKIAICRN